MSRLREGRYHENERLRDIIDSIDEKERNSVNPSYAALAKETRGRFRDDKEVKRDERTHFARDRDRIVYSKSFYHLAGKTQVFLSPKNPFISDRMTHTLHVSSIARAIARACGLNEDLVEAIAFGHDLGHTPFGHLGEQVLNRLCEEHGLGGYRHSDQSLRQIDYIEKGGEGLNLCYEVRDGIVTHCGEEKGGEFWAKEDPTRWDPSKSSMEKREPYTLEGCLVKLCDKIAYVGKDIEDAIEVDLISHEDLPKYCTDILGQTNTEIINTIVLDLIDNFKKDLEEFREEHGRDPDKTEIPIRLSEDVANALDELIFDFNYENIYMCDVNKQYAEKTSVIIEGLFESYYDELMGLTPEEPTELEGTEVLESPKDRDVTEMSVREVVEKIEDLSENKGKIKKLRCMKRDIIRQNIDGFSGSRTSILYFLQDMNGKYLRLSEPTEMVRDSINQMTDSMAISIFESLKIPQPVF